jgi:DNA-binding response OmpR family regulator
VAKILLVDDDTKAAAALKDWLQIERHTVEICGNGSDGLDLINNYKYDLVILDWDMPGLNGLDVLRNLQESGRKTYILMLTGKTALRDKEAGLDHGADDYLTKPFEMRELSARVRALLRRSSKTHSAVLKCRDLELDPSACRVTRDGVELRMLPTEYALLEFFMRHPDQIFSVQSVLEHVWKSESEATITAVRTYMTRLRKKIDVEGQPPYIATIHGLGYKLIGDSNETAPSTAPSS